MVIDHLAAVGRKIEGHPGLKANVLAAMITDVGDHMNSDRLPLHLLVTNHTGAMMHHLIETKVSPTTVHLLLVTTISLHHPAKDAINYHRHRIIIETLLQIERHIAQVARGIPIFPATQMELEQEERGGQERPMRDHEMEDVDRETQGTVGMIVVGSIGTETGLTRDGTIEEAVLEAEPGVRRGGRIATPASERIFTGARAISIAENLQRRRILVFMIIWMNYAWRSSKQRQYCSVSGMELCGAC